MKKYIILVFIFYISSNSYSQDYSVDSLLQLTKTSNNDTIVIKGFIKLYEKFEYQDIDSAIFYCKKAYRLSKLSNNKKFEAYSLYYLGGLFDTKGKYEKAYTYYLEALKIFEKINNKKGLGGCFNCIGIVLWEQCEQSPDDIAQIKLAKALDFIGKGLEYYIEITYYEGIGVCYMNNGIIYNDYAKLSSDENTKNERFNLAISNYKKAIETFGLLNDNRSIADCNLNIALLYYDIYLQKKDQFLSYDEYNLIKNYLNNANNQYIKNNDTYGEAMSLKNLATINIDYSKTQPTNKALLLEAISNSNKSLEYANKLNALFLKYDAYFSLYKAYYQLGDFETALNYHELYSATRDSVFNIKKSDAIQEMETKYETEKQNVQIKELTIDNIKSENTKKISFIIAGFLFLVSIIMIFFFRQKSKSNDILNSKNEELKRLNSTQNKLMSIISHDFKAPISAFLSITTTLNSKIDNLDKSDISKYIKRMQNSSLGLKIQLENMLNWSISQSSEIRVSKAKFNVSSTIINLIIVLEEFANEKQIKLDYSQQENIIVNSDERLVSIVLNNLITNAIKYSNKNSLVQVFVEQHKSKIIIGIKDFGIGIDEINLKNMLSDNNLKHKVTDTGLGLIVTKDIIKKLNGKLWAESELNIGTTFYIELYE